MLNTGIASRISLRTSKSLQFSTNDYSHCLNERRRFADSSPRPCCCCCCYSMYTLPLSACNGYSLYGLRQSSLSQWSPYRRLIYGGLDYYTRLPACDVSEISYCDRVFNLREKSVGRKKRGMRKCLVYEERSEMYDDLGVDEAEIMLSLLTEDIGKDLLVSKETRRLAREPVVEKREDHEVRNKCGNNKKIVDLGVSERESRREHGSVVSSRKNDNRRRKEIIRREEEKEALLREENRKATLREEHKGALLANRTEREKEERKALSRKVSQIAEEKEERESMLRKENEDYLRREEHRQKLRKDGSSCSSYYSFSSNGDYESDNEIELREERCTGDLSSGHKRSSRSDELFYQDTKEQDQRREDYREDHGFGLTKKSSSKEFHTGSSVVDSDFRKKSEKKLVDISVEEMESRKEASVKQSKSSMAHESNYEKTSDYRLSYDTKLDEKKKQQLRQTGEEISRESETMLKYKQRQDTRSGDVRHSSGQQVYSAKGEMSAKVASSNQETVGEHRAVVGHRSREDEYQRNSLKVADVSEIQEIDIRNTSISQQRFETNVKVEDYTTNITIDEAEKQQRRYDQVSGLVESREKSQQLTGKDGNSILRSERDELRKQEESINLASSSSLESDVPRHLMHAKITKSGNDRNESDGLDKVLITHSGNTGACWVEDRTKTKSETQLRRPSNSPDTVAVSVGSKIGIRTDNVIDGSLQLDSTRHEAYGGAKRNTSHGQPSKFISHEDAIGSADRLEKSSVHYVDEFVEQVRNEILSSENQREKETCETKILHEESSGDSHSKKHDSGRDNLKSGTKGPSDEMWNVDEPSFQEPKAEVQDDANKAGNVIVKRPGRSFWNIIADIVHLRWSSHSESHSSDRKTGGRISPNQSTSSEAWFSGHEAEANEEATEEKEGRSVRQGLTGSHREAKTPIRIEESSSSSTSEGHPGNVGINAPSSSVIIERDPPQVSISLPSGGKNSEGNSGHTSSAAVVDSSIALPALRLRRSPAVQGVLEEEEAHTSDSGMSEQLNTGSEEQTGSAVNEGEVKQRLLRKDQVVRDRFEEWEEAYRLEAEQRKIDEMFMREALLEAQKAADNWEVPVGAVLVHNGKIIARGCNLVEELRDSTAHAEMICIREASSTLRTWRLSETTLYATLEPCPMCAGAILQARIDTVVWGAPNKLLGADGSWIRLFPSGDGGNGVELTDKPAAPVHPFHPKMTIRRGVLASECADAMQQFFRRRRKKEKKAETPSPPSSCLPVSHRPSRFMAKMHDAFNLMFCL